MNIRVTAYKSLSLYKVSFPLVGNLSETHPLLDSFVMLEKRIPNKSE
jgi:hypothetical protein